jgi:ArsR family transcriptional regulator, arsenate/arsenite/antimonite-responsive transcriptional repressor
LSDAALNHSPPPKNIAGLTNMLILCYAAAVDPDRIFAALASAARRRILLRLSEGERTTSELAESFAISSPAMSRHLSVLENAGLAASRREGQRVLYSLVRDTLVEAMSGFAAELSPARADSAAKVRREAI